MGRTVKIRNSDPLLHNSHSLAKRHRVLNCGQAQQGMETPYTFRRTAVMVKFKCDIHGWTNARVGAAENAYLAVTGDDGTFELKNLPPGEYTVEAWHAFFGTKTSTLRVSDAATRDVDCTFEDV